MHVCAYVFGYLQGICLCTARKQQEQEQQEQQQQQQQQQQQCIDMSIYVDLHMYT